MHDQFALSSLRREAVPTDGKDEPWNAKENQRSLGSRAKRQGQEGQGDCADARKRIRHSVRGARAQDHARSVL